MDSSATNQKISWFRKEDSAGTLDLSPTFQRRPVWTEEQASFLMRLIPLNQVRLYVVGATLLRGLSRLMMSQ
jgi:hypothetical protein